MLGRFAHPGSTIGPNYVAAQAVEQWDDFTEGWDNSTTENAAKWLVADANGTGAFTVVDDIHGGVAQAETGATGGNDAFAQINGDSIIITRGRRAFFTARFAVEDVDQDEVVIGLCESASDLTALIAGTFDGIGFYANADGNLFFQLGNGTNELTAVDTGVDLTDGDYFDVAFTVYTDTDFAYPRLDVYAGAAGAAGLVLKSQSGQYVPTSGVTSSFGVETNDTGADWIRVDYIGAASER